MNDLEWVWMLWFVLVFVAVVNWLEIRRDRKNNQLLAQIESARRRAYAREFETLVERLRKEGFL